MQNLSLLKSHDPISRHCLYSLSRPAIQDFKKMLEQEINRDFQSRKIVNNNHFINCRMNLCQMLQQISITFHQNCADEGSTIFDIEPSERVFLLQQFLKAMNEKKLEADANLEFEKNLEIIYQNMKQEQQESKGREK